MTQARYFQATLSPVARELAPARWRSRRHKAECGCLTLLDGCTGTAAPSSASKLARHRGGIFAHRRAFNWQVAADDPGTLLSGSTYPRGEGACSARWRSRRHTAECGLPDTPRWLYWDGCAVQREQARSPQGIFINRRAFSWPVAAHDAGPARSESVYPALTQCSQAAPIPVARELAPARWRSRRHRPECGMPDTPR